MRYQRNSSLTVSEDDSNIPKQLRFSEIDQEVLDTTILKEAGGNSIDLPESTTDWEIPMGAIGSGKWFYLFSSVEITLKIDDGPARTLAAGKPNECWMEYTSLKISTTTAATRLTYATGGE